MGGFQTCLTALAPFASGVTLLHVEVVQRMCCHCSYSTILPCAMLPCAELLGDLSLPPLSVFTCKRLLPNGTALQLDC